MHHAASQGNAICLESLIKAGGNTKITDNEGQTCFEIAKGPCVAVLQKLEGGCEKFFFSEFYN